MTNSSFIVFCFLFIPSNKHESRILLFQFRVFKRLNLSFCRESSCGVMANMLDCDITVSEFECYITYAMDFRFVPSDPVCFDKLSRCD